MVSMRRLLQTIVTVLVLTLLLVGAVFTEAATADITDIVFTTTPTEEIMADETGKFTVETHDSSGAAELTDSDLTVSLDDGSNDGTFYEYSAGSCSDTELANDETTISNGSSTTSFCYGNSAGGDYDIRVTATIAGSGASTYADTDTYGAENVWTDYTHVYHMAEDPSGGSGAIMDSTGNDDLTATGTMTSNDLVSATLGNGLDFDGTDDYLTGFRLGLGDNLTASVWMNVTDNGDEMVLVGDGTTHDSLRIEQWQNTGNVGVTSDKINNADYGYATPFGSQAHVVWRIDSTSSTTDSFLNGSSVGSPIDFSSSSSGIDIDDLDHIGGANINDGGSPTLRGVIDELRFTYSVRSSEWISAEYTSQNTPTTFYTTGSEETGSGSGWYGDDWDHRKQITIAASEIDSDLTDFPVYVDLSDLGSDFFSGVKDNGGDIRITTSDGEAELPREVVSVDTSGETGELHFKADSLSSSAGTDFYIYYGNTDEINATAHLLVAATGGTPSGQRLAARGSDSDDGEAKTEDDTEPEEADQDEESDEELTSQEVSYYRQVLNDASNVINEITQSVIKTLIRQRTGLEPWNF